MAEPEPLSAAADTARNGLLARARSEPWRSSLILLSIPVLIILFTYFGSADFYRREILPKVASRGDLNTFLYHHLGGFLLLGLGSLLLARALGLRGRELGLGVGDARRGLRFVAWALPLVVLPLTFLGSYAPEVAREYPLAKDALRSPQALALHSAFYVLYYIGWEFHFRGYALFGLARQFGQWPAILIQTIPSALIHTSLVSAGKPFAETLGAIPAGIVLGWLALRTGSIWYGVLLHAALGLSTDFWQYLHYHGVL